jgi:integrase
VVPRTRLKTEAAERCVPICPELAAILRGWRWRARSSWVVPASDRTKPWTSGGRGQKPTQRLSEAGRAVGVTGLTFQSLRHSFATWGRRRWGIPAPVMRDILGHTMIATHEAHYLHSPEDAAELSAAMTNVTYRLAL